MTTYAFAMDTLRHSGVDETPIATVVVPVKTVSEANRATHEHWRVRHKRSLAQKSVTTLAMMADNQTGSHARPLSWMLPLHIHMTRLAPRRIRDSDNAAGSCKYVRDAVAKFLGVDDGDETKVTWSNWQEPSKTYGVRVEFFRRKAA